MDYRHSHEVDHRNSKHLPTLDGLRGLAIMLVMLFHQCIMQPSQLLDKVFVRACDLGWCGVDLFFVLSGFLITGILSDSKGQPGYFRNFYARRILRIFPLYYSVMFVCLFVLPLFSHAKIANFRRISGDEFWYWSYLSNFSIARAGTWRHGILDVSWSLAIEEQFYLFWPLVVLVLSSRSLRRLCMALFVGALFFRIMLVARGANPLIIYVLTPCRIDAIAVGAWIAVYERQVVGGRRRLAQLAARWIGPLGLAVVLFAVCSKSRYSQDSPIMQTAGFSALALCFGGLLLLVATAEPKTLFYAVFNHRLLRTFGKYSYALYFFHLPLRALVRDTLFTPDQFSTIIGSRIPGQLLFCAVSTVLTCIAAWLSWHFFEKYFLGIKRYFAYEAAVMPQPIENT